MKEKELVKIIDLKDIKKAVLHKKRTYIYVFVIVFILSCVWILPQPRYYDCDVSLAPESNGEDVGGGLSSIASSFGINLGDIGGSDAIYPLLYPDLFESPEFIVSLFDIKVRTEDGEVNTDYYTYMTKHQKKNMLTRPFALASKYVKDLFKPKKKRGSSDGNQRINPFYMSEEDYMLVQQVMGNIRCAVDKKTNVISIMVRDQDPLVCATMTDSVKERLQDFIIKYKTSKIRLDCDYYQHLTDSAKVEYEEALKAYSDYSDSHKDIILQAYISERDKLENDMSVKYNTYSAMNTQLQAMKAKVQEKTPSFTTLKSVTVPIKPSGPKRMIFVGAMLVLSFICTALWKCRKILFKFDGAENSERSEDSEESEKSGESEISGESEMS